MIFAHLYLSPKGFFHLIYGSVGKRVQLGEPLFGEPRHLHRHQYLIPPDGMRFVFDGSSGGLEQEQLGLLY